MSILYAENAPHSNPTITASLGRKYYGIGAALIAFGIKFSIDHGCRGDVVFDAKTEELARHYAEDFHAGRFPAPFPADLSGFCWLTKVHGVCFQDILQRRSDCERAGKYVF